MDWPHLHLMVNHFPIVLTLLGTAAAILALLTGRRVVWLYAVATLTLAGISVGPAFITGDQAGDVVHTWPHANRQVIHAHEEAADTALWVVLAMGVCAAYAWWRLARMDGTEMALPGWLRGIVFVLAVAGSLAVAYAGLKGGEIAHGSTTPPTLPTTAPFPGST